MKNLKWYNLYFVIGTIVVGIVMLYLFKDGTRAVSLSTEVQNSTADVVNTFSKNPSDIVWNTFENKRYGYSLLLPSSVKASTQQMYDVDPRDSYQVVFYEDNNSMGFVFSIEALKERESWKIEPSMAQPFPSDIKKLAEELYAHQSTVSGDIDSSQGGLREVVINGNHGYSFALTKEFSWGKTGGYFFLDNTIRNFVLLENDRDEKYLISYSVGNIFSEKMIDSFEFK